MNGLTQSDDPRALCKLVEDRRDSATRYRKLATLFAHNAQIATSPTRAKMLCGLAEVAERDAAHAERMAVQLQALAERLA